MSLLPFVAMNAHLSSIHAVSPDAVAGRQPHEAAVHRLVHRLAVVDGDVLLEATVVSLEPRAAVEHHLHILRCFLPRLED